MVKDAELRTLPIEGLVLRELVMAGNGKDAEVRVLTSDGRRFVFGSSMPRLKITVQGVVSTEVTGPDDATLKLRSRCGCCAMHAIRCSRWAASISGSLRCSSSVALGWGWID